MSLDESTGDATTLQGDGSSGEDSVRAPAAEGLPLAELDAEFALCLTHDVDRPFKRPHQALYYGVRERRIHHLLSLLPGRNPYWRFDDVMALEEELGVRSAFYFLASQSPWSAPPRKATEPNRLIEHIGQYDPRRSDIAEVIHRLEAGGWEIGLHGSPDSASDEDRLATEYDRLNALVDGRIGGCRHHHLQIAGSETLANQAAVGLEYDTSYGSSVEYGFHHGGNVMRPLPGGPVEFPLTLMEVTLPNPESQYPAAWTACERLLRSARAGGRVMTVLWHLRYFSERDFPGYRRIYRRMIERARDMGAWIGPPGDLLELLEVGDSDT